MSLPVLEREAETIAFFDHAAEMPSLIMSTVRRGEARGATTLSIVSTSGAGFFVRLDADQWSTLIGFLHRNAPRPSDG